MKKLIRNGQHMRPMLAVAMRAGVGSPDGYGRGVWVSHTDLPALLDYFQRFGEEYNPGDYWCNGTCIHNQVLYSDFLRLFGKEG